MFFIRNEYIYIYISQFHYFQHVINSLICHELLVYFRWLIFLCVSIDDIVKLFVLITLQWIIWTCLTYINSS